MTHLQEQLVQLRNTVDEMINLVEGQLKKSMAALVNNDIDIANEVMFNEKRVNATELKIDKDCENIFALLTPVAHDMRFVFASLKINADMERIGDYADGIARVVVEVRDGFDTKLMQVIELVKMYEIALDMLNKISIAYNSDDTRQAKVVFSQDLLINEINYHATAKIAEYCRNNPANIEQALHLLSIVRKLERVGDHITNIAEEIIFYKEAKVLKHGRKGKLED